MGLIDRYFGDATLYLCYRFYDRFKNPPKDFDQLFDYLRICKLEHISGEIAKAIAGSKRG